MKFLDELKWRGLFKDVTNEEALTKRLETPITLYCGFDPTATSLHVGHLQQLILLKRYQAQGHHPIALIGGATGMIGDPRPTSERSMLDDAALQANIDGISAQIKQVLEADSNPVKTVNNRDWLGKLSMLDFLRDYGKHFSVANMVAKDTIAKRLSTGISYTEFSYTILQAIDFLNLYRNEGVQLQIGGSDQWGNLVSGTELIRRVEGHEAEVFGVTSPLIMKSDGTKFGKSEGNNIWLDPEMTDPYTFYQFWINTSDADIIDFTKRLSMKSVDEIKAIEQSFESSPHERLAQKELAHELTLMLHGQEGLDMALRMTQALFSGNVSELSVKEIRSAFADTYSYDLETEALLLDFLVESKILPSKREARQMINDGAIRVNGKVVKDLDFLLSKENAMEGVLTLIRRGKKNYYIVNHI